MKALLFDTSQLVRSLERLYAGMWQDFESGQLPLPDLRNLDAYAEIGIDINSSVPLTSSVEGLEDRYRRSLAEWHRTYPLQSDARLWR